MKDNKSIIFPITPIINYRERCGVIVNRESLAAMQNADLKSCDSDSLVDIVNVDIDKSKSTEDKISDYINKVGNPYLFKVGDIAVKVSYSKTGKSLSEAIASSLNLQTFPR